MFQCRNIKLSNQLKQRKLPNPQSSVKSSEQKPYKQTHCLWTKDIEKKELKTLVPKYHVLSIGRWPQYVTLSQSSSTTPPAKIWPVARLSNTKTRSLSLVLLKPSNVIVIQCTLAAVTSTRNSTTNISSNKHFTGLEDIPSNCTRKNVVGLSSCDGFRWMSSYHIVPTFVKFAN